MTQNNQAPTEFCKCLIVNVDQTGHEICRAMRDSSTERLQSSKMGQTDKSEGDNRR